ncbi:MAG TPA: PKD domain-containing protein [Candidatus Microsaccharimonas sp.]|jgi:hypothetical protein
MAITFVGQAATSVFAPSATKAYVSTAGNALILSLQHQSFSPPTITDTAGNTWIQGPDTVVDGTGAPSEKQVGLWYVINALPITSLTVTTSGAGSKAIQFNLSEWRGVDSLRAKSSTYAATPSTNSAAAPVTAQTGDLVIGNMGYYDATGRDDSLVSGYTALTGNAISTTYQSVGYRVVTTTASAGPTYTYTRNTQSGIAVASFVPATVRTIGIAATATYNPTGLQNPSTTGAVIPIPSGGVVGQYVIAAVFFAQGTGPASIVTPTNWTVLTPAGLTGTSANRVTILYGYKITDATALSNLGSSFLAKVGYSSTRIVAVTHLMNNVDLNATPSIGLIEFSASAASSITFNSPAAGDYRLYFPATNSSAPTPNSVMTSTGGTKNVQVQSLDVASGSSADSQIASMTGGTGATLSASVPNHVSFGVGFMAAYIPVANIPPTASFTHSEAGLVTTVNGSASSDTDGTIASYDWNWGDGTTHGTTATTTHTYASAGTYSAILTVTDNSGGTGTATQTITVGTTTAPTRKGYSFTNPAGANTSLVLDPSIITSGTGVSTNDWMIATLTTTTTTTTLTAPTGWTTLRSLTTIGTLRYAVYGKIRASGDTTYSFTLDAGGTTSAGTLMWGSGADTTVTNWLVGANTNRSVDLHNTGASITTTVDHSLILGISVERTSVTESAITSVSGATEWYFMPQIGSQLETIDVAYVADKTPTGATTTIDWTYPNTQTTNGMALQIAIPPTAPGGNISIGYPGVLRVGTTNYSGKMYYWDGSAAHDFSTTPIVKFQPATVTQLLSSDHSPWFAAHRGFSYSYPEESIYSYRSATDWGIHAIEISVQVSQDGTFWCFHDSTTTRTTGVSGTISSMTDATLAALSNLGSTATGNTSQPSRPVSKLIDVLNVYAATHVIIIEDKTYTNTTNILNLMDSYGTTGRPASEIFIWKLDALSGSGFFTAASSRGYHRWGYIFDASMATSYATVVSSGKMDMIGLDFNSSDATLTSAVALAISNGVRPTGHIISTTTQRDRMLGLGMTGLMVSNKDIVPPWYTSWGGF